MKPLLRILIIEDSEDDALLVLHQIKKGDYDIEYERVQTAETMKAALHRKIWNIVLSDYVMPHFNGLEALEVLKESGIDLPFIIISGIIGEEVAVEVMKAGAHDYIMKKNLKRLLPAIERELRESKSRAERKLLEQKQKQTEEALRESEERYRLIAENTADTIAVMDLNLNPIYISPSVQKLRGYTVQEAMSLSLNQYLTPESFQKAMKVFDDQMTLETSKSADPSRSVLLELEEIHKNGSIIQVEIAVSTIRDNQLNPIRLLIVTRDITQRREVEEKLKILSRAVEQSPDMILITDTEGNIEYVNPKFEEVTGYSMTEVIGKKPSIIKSGKMPDKLYKDMWDTLKADNVWNGELINKKRSGDFYWVNTSISPITDKKGNVSHYVGLAEDITHKKEIEEELIIAKEHAEESDRLKTAFLQNMSHEIRTPMNAIMGFSELMTLEYNNKEKLDEYSQIINNSCSDLLKIINGIIDIAKIESRQLTIRFEECNLKTVFSELTLFFNEFKIRMGKQQIEFTLQNLCDSSDMVIKTDSVKLKQILINLISNAFKFTDTGKIDGGCKYDENHNLIFYVSDTGIGIPKDKQNAVFERFIKLNQDKTKLQNGTGIGLSIVKGLIDLLGGEIWLESEPNKGSTFYFSLPYKLVKPSECRSMAETEPIEYNFENRTILIVEDDIINTQYIKEILFNKGLAIIHTQYGKEAVEIALKQPIDLVLMDIHLPDITGYEATRQIKQKKKDLKIIAQTAYANTDDRQKALDCGCVDYISKPFKYELLLLLLNKHLRK